MHRFDDLFAHLNRRQPRRACWCLLFLSGLPVFVSACGGGSGSAANDVIVNRSQALRIEAPGAHVAVSSSSSLDLTSSITIEAWVSFDAADVPPGVSIVKRGDANTGYNLGINPSTRLVGGIFNQHSNLITDPPEFGEEWHHVAWTFDGLVSRIYFDGLLVQEMSYSGSATTTTSDLVFGIGVDEDGTWNGATAQAWYDEIRIWNTARTPEQILAWFDRSLTGTEAGLVGYWTFDLGDAQDASPSGNHGILAGGAEVRVRAR